MTVARGFIIAIASGIGFGVAGAGAGYVLATVAPDYYRIVFRLPESAGLDPVQAGIGLGLTQGLGAGLAVGLVIVGIVAWYNSRTSSQT